VARSPHNSRAHARIPLSVEVEYRTASSFLVAYSVNLSRGGLFLESQSAPAVGTALNLELRVPGGEGPIPVRGRVTWIRGENDPSGPPGFGVAFDEVAHELGQLIDQLVAQFSGLTVVVLCPNQRDCPAVARMIRSIIHTADVVSAAEAHIAETLITDEVDLLLVAADDDPDAAMRLLERRGPPPRVPAIVLTSDPALRARALAAGADEVAGNPPAYAEFQRQLVRALGRPRGVKL
jgi:uncharacterized protein (TIGR02266 family)